MPGVIPVYPPSLRCCHSLMLVRRLTAQTAPASTLPPAVSRVARPHLPPVVAVLRFFVTLRSHNTATPAPIPLRYANSAGRSTQPTGRALRSYVSPGHLPGLRSRSRTTCSLRLSRHSLRRRRTTLALRLSADRPPAERLLPVLESGQSPSFHSGPSPASAVLINPVPLSMDRTAPHFVRHRTVHSAPPL